MWKTSKFSRLLIDVLPMTNSNDIDQKNFILDFINYPIIRHSYAKTTSSLQFLITNRPRVIY
jgi:hypothetical protein